LKITIELEMDIEQQAAMCQLCKRIGFGDVREHASSGSQAYLMLEGLHQIQAQLEQVKPS
jgi:hypothetical protein